MYGYTSVALLTLTSKVQSQSESDRTYLAQLTLSHPSILRLYLSGHLLTGITSDTLCVRLAFRYSHNSPVIIRDIAKSSLKQTAQEEYI